MSHSRFLRTSPSTIPTVLLVFALAGPAPAAAQERTLYVSAVDRKGEPVAGLGADAFSLKENGKARQVVSATPATDPLDIVLLFDDSASTTDTIRFQRDATAKFVQTMAPKANISIVALADRPRTVVGYTNNADTLTQGISRIFTQTGTQMTLLDAVIGTSEGLAQRGTARRVIVALVTDGMEYTSKLYKHALTAMRAFNVQFHSVAVGRFQVDVAASASQQSMAERTVLIEEGPRDTGGQRMSIINASGLATEMDRLSRELSGQYKVRYNSSEPLKADRSDRIEIKSNKKDITMRGTLVRAATR